MRALFFPIVLATIAVTFVTSPVAAQEQARPSSESGRTAAETYDVTTMGRLPTPPGGVVGNAPFNNQIRKHTAPFEANGSGR